MMTPSVTFRERSRFVGGLYYLDLGVKSLRTTRPDRNEREKGNRQKEVGGKWSVGATTAIVHRRRI